MKNYWENKKVLITGASGFIGSHFVEELDKKGAHVKAVYSHKNNTINYLEKACKNVEYFKVDLTKIEGIKTLSQHTDTIINCAALDGNAQFKKSHAALILDINMQITSHILDSAIENGIKNVVLLSSAEVYPQKAKNPLNEDDDYKTNFDNTSNGYVISKRFTEILGELYTKQYKLNVYLPRPTNTYGPRDNFSTDLARVIPSFISKMNRNEKVEIWGDGKQIRQFLYIKDLVSIVLNQVEKGEYGIFNVSSDSSISILRLAKLIGKLLNKNYKIHCDLTKPQGNTKRILDISKIQKGKSFHFISMNEGLTETINWYKKNI